MGSSRAILAEVRYEARDGSMSQLWQSDGSENDI